MLLIFINTNKMDDINEFDLNFGGVYYPNANNLWEAEGIKPEGNVNNLILKLEKERLNKIPKAPSQPYQSFPISPPLPPPQPKPISNTPTYLYQPTPPKQPPPQKKDEYTQVTPQQQPIYKYQQREPQKEVVYVKEYNPIVYNRLYDWSLGYIPSYYTWDQRKRLEELLALLIRTELSNKYSSNRSKSELEQLIKDAIKKFNSEVDIKPKKATRKVSRKPKSKKASKKPKSKKTSKPKRKISKKTSKKTSKKKSTKKTNKK